MSATAEARTARPASAFRAWLARQPRRHLLLVALLPVLVVAWLPIVGGRAPAQPKAAAAPGAAGGVAAGIEPAAAPLGETAGSAVTATIDATAAFEARVLELTQPFRPRFGAELLPPPEPSTPTTEAATAAAPVLVPSAILLSRGGEPLAIVQGHAYRVGDTVAGRTIVAIEERRVVYREGGRTFAAAMGEALGTQR